MITSASATSSAGRVLGDDGGPDSRRPPSASRAAPMAPGGAGAGFGADVAPAAVASAAAQVGQPRSSRSTVADRRPSAGRTRGLRRVGPERMLDVGGGDQLDRRQPRDGGVEAAERLDHAAPAVGTGTTAQPDHDASGARLQRGIDEVDRLPAVRGDGGLHRRRTPEQGPDRTPARTRRRPSRRGVVDPLCGHGVGQRTADHRRTATAEAAGEHVDEAGTAVGLGGSVNRSPGRARCQPVAMASQLRRR